MMVMKPQAALLQAVNFFSLGGWGIVRFQEVAEGNVEQGKESTWIDHLTQFSSKDDLKRAVDNMQYLGEGTYTATALHAANRMFEAARLGVKKVALVITDEQTDRRDEKNLTEVVKDASDIDVEIFVIGVVKRNDPNFKMFHKEMNLIATDPDSEHV